MTNKRIRKDLKHLYRILEAGEKGYAVSAINTNNRGLKIFFKSFAQQRAKFKEEILTEIRRIGGETKPGRSLLGAIHRGRINIFAALMIGKEEREKMVLKEILVGERFAMHAYVRALKQELPAEIIELITRQQAEVEKVFRQVALMRGKEGRRMVVRLFETEIDADAAELEMKNAGLYPEAVLRVNIRNAVDVYEDHNPTVTETIISGAVGGALWGCFIGALAGLGMRAAGLVPIETASGQGIWVFLALAGIFVGEFVGSLLGFAIGVGVSGEDSYQYEMSLKHGKLLLLAQVDALRALEAGQIMAQINLNARNKIEEIAA